MAMRPGRHSSHTPMHASRRCGYPTKACRCSAVTATCAITRSRCGIATCAPSPRSKAQSASNQEEPQMIDFELTSTDQEILQLAREQAKIGRRYADYYDKHEDELAPEGFPEAEGLPNPVVLAEEGAVGSSGSR